MPNKHKKSNQHTAPQQQQPPFKPALVFSTSSTSQGAHVEGSSSTKISFDADGSHFQYESNDFDINDEGASGGSELMATGTVGPVTSSSNKTKVTLKIVQGMFIRYTSHVTKEMTRQYPILT